MRAKTPEQIDTSKAKITTTVNDQELAKLYKLYHNGSITLRTLASQLGVSYRRLYDILAAKGWPL